MVSAPKVRFAREHSRSERPRLPPRHPWRQLGPQRTVVGARRVSQHERACEPLQLHRFSLRAAGKATVEGDPVMYVIRGGSHGDAPEVTLWTTFAFKYAPTIRYKCFGFRPSLRACQSRT